jgi:flagellar hook assembly protein FlgD
MPNPFNPSTRISFSLSLESEVTIEVYDTTGRKIVTLARARFSAGSHAVVWEARDRQGRDVSSGTYFYRVSAGTHAVTRKMLFLR